MALLSYPSNITKVVICTQAQQKTAAGVFMAGLDPAHLFISFFVWNVTGPCYDLALVEVREEPYISGTT